MRVMGEMISDCHSLFSCIFSIHLTRPSMFYQNRKWEEERQNRNGRIRFIIKKKHRKESHNVNINR